MPIIYRKTAKGVTEIETRAFKLAPRGRSTLILVDGKRDADVLKGMIQQQADEMLAMLLEQGFIEMAGESTPAPLEQGLAGGSPVAQPGAKAAGGPAPGGDPSAADFAKRRLAAVRDLNQALGPTSEMLAIKMERARNADELRPLIQIAAQVIASARSRAAGEAYATRHAL